MTYEIHRAYVDIVPDGRDFLRRNADPRVVGTNGRLKPKMSQSSARTAKARIGTSLDRIIGLWRLDLDSQLAGFKLPDCYRGRCLVVNCDSLPDSLQSAFGLHVNRHLSYYGHTLRVSPFTGYLVHHQISFLKTPGLYPGFFILGLLLPPSIPSYSRPRLVRQSHLTKKQSCQVRGHVRVKNQNSRPSVAPPNNRLSGCFSLARGFHCNHSGCIR